MITLDDILAQWASERPDLDVSAMAVVGRLSRASTRIDERLSSTFARHALDRGSFDVLATLRRSGAPYALSPSNLAASSMVTTAAVAQRLNRLEARGLVSRSQSRADKRGTIVTLTTAGRSLIDAALPDHVATETSLLGNLTEPERDQLARLLQKLLD